MRTCHGTAKRSGARPVSRGTSDRMTPDRITASFFGAVAFGCFGAAGYLLTSWWMGQ